MAIHGRLSRILASITLLTFSVAVPAAADPKDASAPTAAAVNTSQIRIDNFGRVSPTYYRGAQPMRHDYADLATLGVKTVVDLTSDDGQRDERELVEHAGMKYVHIPMTTHRSPTASELAQFLGVVTDSASGPVYVHCVGGKHRTGVMTAAYRMTHDGWSSEQAFREMKQYKFGADFLHPEFKKFVYTFRPEPNPARPDNTVLATVIN